MNPRLIRALKKYYDTMVEPPKTIRQQLQKVSKPHTETLDDVRKRTAENLAKKKTMTSHRRPKDGD